MKTVWNSARKCCEWTGRTLRRVWVLAFLFLLAGGALFSIGQLQAYQTVPAVSSFHHDGNGTGVLLLHGFGGSPLEVEPLAERLAERGFTVSVPLLPGHGATPREFAATTNEQYLAAAREALQTLRHRCDRLYVVGFSMGGLIALQLEQEECIDGLVLMSTPIQPWNDFADFSLLKMVATSGTRLHVYVPTLGIPRWIREHRRQSKGLPPGSIEPAYAAYPAASCLRVLEMIERVKPQLAQVTAPTLILQSRDDHVSAPSSAEYLLNHLGTAEKRLIYLENAGHTVALGRQSEQVRDRVEEFVATGLLP